MKRTAVLSVTWVYLLVAGCTWVKLSDEAQNVHVSLKEDVSGCKSLAKTTVSVKHSVIGVERNKEKVQLELNTLARNAAAKKGGNVIVPESDVVEGEQTFAIYQCP